MRGYNTNIVYRKRLIKSRSFLQFSGSFVEWGGMPAVHKKPLTCLRIHLKRLLFSKYLKIIALTLQINPFIRQFMQNHTP